MQGDTCQVSTCRRPLIAATSQPPPHRNRRHHRREPLLVGWIWGLATPTAVSRCSRRTEWWITPLPMRRHPCPQATACGVGFVLCHRGQGRHCRSLTHLTHLRSYDRPTTTPPRAAACGVGSLLCHWEQGAQLLLPDTPRLLRRTHDDTAASNCSRGASLPRPQLLCSTKSAIAGLPRRRSC